MEDMSQHRHAAVAEVTTSRERTRKAAQPVLDGLKVKCMTFCSAINTSLARALGRVDHRLACGMVDDVFDLDAACAARHRAGALLGRLQQTHGIAQ